jgi:hypothetical protein
MPPIAQTSSPSIVNLNQGLAWACLVLAVLLPLAALYGLWAASPEMLLAQAGVHLPQFAGALTPPVVMWQRVLAVAIGLLPMVGVAYGLVRAWQCFSGFARGAVFSLGTVEHLRGFASGLLGSSVAGLLAPSLLSVLLTWGAAAGERSLAVALGGQHLLLMLFAGIVWQIAHAMARAIEIADDNAQII